MATPIFILSLPRSGSTLLQRLVATHPAVATTAEPWLLLPLFLGYREGHLFASYRQRYLAAAFDDFLATLADGRKLHRTAVRRFAETFYDGARRPGQTHFLDKTPRYHLIADELLDTFPDARVVLLWRNPLAVAASMIEKWGGGRFRLYEHRIDLYEGLARLVEVARRRRERLLPLRYEDLTAEPESHLTRVFEHCGLPAIDAPLDRLGTVRLAGRMGDSKTADSSDVREAPPGAWTAKLATLPRRRWARRYLRWLGSERLSVMGYQASDLTARLAAEPVAWRPTLGDLTWMLWGRLAVASQAASFRRRHLLRRQGRSPAVPYE